MLTTCSVVQKKKKKVKSAKKGKSAAADAPAASEKAETTTTPVTPAAPIAAPATEDSSKRVLAASVEDAEEEQTILLSQSVFHLAKGAFCRSIAWIISHFELGGFSCVSCFIFVCSHFV